MKKIVICTGGFDPLHSGHLSYLRDAKRLGDWLIVGINSDTWLTRKKGRPFMPIWERTELVQSLKMVDQVAFFGDNADADGSACHFIQETLALFPNDEIIFANGGDRTDKNIPEMSIDDPRLTFVFGVGGFSKHNSSSRILDEWKNSAIQRPWGNYRVLHEVSGTKVKELTINPGQKLSMQRHKERSEFWLVSSGRCDVERMTTGEYELPVVRLQQHDSFHILPGEWHRITNLYDEPCKIVEIQYGSRCDENDIERH